MIVDDEVELVNSLSRIFKLEFPDAQIDQAFDGQQALSQLIQNKYDLLITDLNMPKLEGNDLIGKLVRDHHDYYPAAIIVISGYINLAGEKKVIENIHFIQKPFRISDLVKLAKELM